MRTNKYKSLATREFALRKKATKTKWADACSRGAVCRDWGRKNYDVNTNTHFRRRDVASKPITINLYILREEMQVWRDAFSIINTFQENERKNEKMNKKNGNKVEDVRYGTRTAYISRACLRCLVSIHNYRRRVDLNIPEHCDRD